MYHYFKQSKEVGYDEKGPNIYLPLQTYNRYKEATKEYLETMYKEEIWGKIRRYLYGLNM